MQRRYLPLIDERQPAGREQPEETNMSKNVNKVVELKNQEIENVVGGVVVSASTSYAVQRPLTTTSTTLQTSGTSQTFSVAGIKL
jgi:hypothetical protein